MATFWDNDLQVAMMQEVLIREAVAARLSTGYTKPDEIRLLSDCMMKAANSREYYEKQVAEAEAKEKKDDDNGNA